MRAGGRLGIRRQIDAGIHIHAFGSRHTTLQRFDMGVARYADDQVRSMHQFGANCLEHLALEFRRMPGVIGNHQWCPGQPGDYDGHKIRARIMAL